jgi:hypothetical protein
MDYRKTDWGCEVEETCPESCEMEGFITTNMETSGSITEYLITEVLNL